MSLSQSALCATVRAEVTLAQIFPDHAVLQRDQPLPVWGWASPGEKVSVSLDRQQAQSVVDDGGKWIVRIPSHPMSRVPLVLTALGDSNSIQRRDILLGDVGLCSGQSNMEFPLAACDAQPDIQSADFPLIRQFGVEMHFAFTTRSDFNSHQQFATPSA